MHSKHALGKEDVSVCGRLVLHDTNTSIDIIPDFVCNAILSVTSLGLRVNAYALASHVFDCFLESGMEGMKRFSIEAERSQGNSSCADCCCPALPCD